MIIPCHLGLQVIMNMNARFMVTWNLSVGILLSWLAQYIDCHSVDSRVHQQLQCSALELFGREKKIMHRALSKCHVQAFFCSSWAAADVLKSWNIILNCLWNHIIYWCEEVSWTPGSGMSVILLCSDGWKSISVSGPQMVEYLCQSVVLLCSEGWIS